MDQRNAEPCNIATPSPSREQLLDEWHSMTNDEQDAAFDDFREAVYYGGGTPSLYWFPLFIGWC